MTSTRPSRLRSSTVTAAVGRPSADALIGLCLAGALILLAFITTGGFDESITVSGTNTWSQVVITVLGAGACAAMLVLGGRGHAWGGVTVALFAALTAMTALSITWSVQPDDSWQAANLTVAYLAAFAGAAALARLMPERWRALVGAIALTTVVLSAYALLRKIFPQASDTFGRLQTPFGYWNAIGAVAAMGIPPCLWQFRRRDTGPIARGLAVPALAILFSVVVLSYSRSAAIVALLAMACSVGFAPRRLSATAALALSAAGAAVICGWALSHPVLTTDYQPFSLRTSAGHTFGIVLLVCLLALTAAGIATARASERIALSDALRRRIGTVLLVGVAVVPVLGVAALAESSRGLSGQISHAWQSLTSTNARVGDTASRFGTLGSSRPLYWHEGISVGEHALLHGVGALGYATASTRYATNFHVAIHAHSYVIQTFADLGLIGLGLTLALLIAWGIAAARAVALPTRWAAVAQDAVPEREGLVALGLVVIVFGVQSTFDWTWYFEAVTVPALLCAGWLAGRGPLSIPVGRAARRAPILARPAVGGAVTALAAVAMVGGWLIWQPLRSADAVTSSETAASQGHLAAAFHDARSAASLDPLALEPRFVLSSLYQASGDLAAARSELVRAVRLQPDNSVSWLQLGSFDLQNHQPGLALPSLQRAYMLDPTSLTTFTILRQAQSQLSAGG
jgi:hypothetical protein